MAALPELPGAVAWAGLQRPVSAKRNARDKFPGRVKCKPVSLNPYHPHHIPVLFLDGNLSAEGAGNVLQPL